MLKRFRNYHSRVSLNPQSKPNQYFYHLLGEIIVIIKNGSLILNETENFKLTSIV